MTLAPRDLALAAMAAPEPESRLTSRSTFAPLVSICSACCCCVDLSASAFSMIALAPAASIAFFSSGRSTVSQRTDDLVSGSRTPTVPIDFFALDELDVEELPLELELLSLLPQPATTPASALVPTDARTASLRDLGTSINTGFSLLVMDSMDLLVSRHPTSPAAAIRAATA